MTQKFLYLFTTGIENAISPDDSVPINVGDSMGQKSWCNGQVSVEDGLAGDSSGHSSGVLRGEGMDRATSDGSN